MKTGINIYTIQGYPHFFSFSLYFHNFKNTRIESVQTSEITVVMVSCNGILLFLVMDPKFQRA
jgi:hypothetical protein